MKVFIGTLYSGENEFQKCVASIKKQKYGDVYQFVLKNMPNREAHQRLYDTFSENKNEYDFFLKVDADMIFEDEHAITKIVFVFDNNPNLDHLIIPVFDGLSQKYILGLHAFSNRVQWPKIKENVYVDPYPYTKLDYKIWQTKDCPFIFHSPDPTNYQAFLFGVHRSIKMKEAARRKYLAGFLSQANLVCSVFKHWNSQHDAKRMWFLVGVLCSHEYNLVEMKNKSGTDLKEAFTYYLNRSEDELIEYINKRVKPMYKRYLMISDVYNMLSWRKAYLKHGLGPARVGRPGIKE